VYENSRVRIKFDVVVGNVRWIVAKVGENLRRRLCRFVLKEYE
jgi:hypothetical protein